MNKFNRVFTGIAEGFRAARFHSALNRLSDRQLADIGLNRDSISQRALELAQMR